VKPGATVVVLAPGQSGRIGPFAGFLQLSDQSSLERAPNDSKIAA